MSRRSRVVLVAVVAVVFASCGLPMEDQARVAEGDDVPFGLLDEVGAEQPQLPPPSAREDEVTVYLIDGEQDRLVEVRRNLSPDASPDERLDALSEGPSGDEKDQGLRSAFAGSDIVAATEMSGGIASVDLAPAFLELDGEEQLLAIAQIVYTLTARPGVGRVNVTLEGERVEIPRGDGSLTTGSVSRDSYRELAAG